MFYGECIMEHDWLKRMGLLPRIPLSHCMFVILLLLYFKFHISNLLVAGNIRCIVNFHGLDNFPVANRKVYLSTPKQRNLLCVLGIPTVSMAGPPFRPHESLTYI